MNDCTSPHDTDDSPRPKPGTVLRAWRLLWVGVPAALLAVVFASGCSHAPSKTKETKTIEVHATTPITDEVTDYQDFTGRLEAIKTVDVRARVNGYITA